MIIFPAVDIMKGKVVRLYQGDFDRKTFYPGDPVEAALTWKKKGAEFLHIIDLDGARTGEVKNGEVIRSIIKEAGISCEAGGGLRTGDDAEYFLSAGATRVIFGTKAFEDVDFLKNLVSEFGEKRIVVSVDFSQGMVVKKGWQETTQLAAEKVLELMERAGVGTIVATDIKTDGTLKGPNVGGLKKILAATSMKVVASGGVSCLGDVESLRALNADNLEGVIIGKALYDGKLKLEDAIKAAI